MATGSAQDEQGLPNDEVRTTAEKRVSAGGRAVASVDDACHEGDDGRVHEEQRPI